MPTKKEEVERRERLIDEALKESFPASDPPFFVGAGEPHPTDSTVGTQDDHPQQ